MNATHATHAMRASQTDHAARDDAQIESGNAAQPADGAKAKPTPTRLKPASRTRAKHAPTGRTSTGRSSAKRSPAKPTPVNPADIRRRALGRYGEDLATRRLIESGMRILDRNWRCREGEIDIVAADGDAVVVCEVKTRRAGSYEHPMAAVRPVKAARLRLLAERWLERHGGPPPGGVRIDVIGVLLPARGAPVVQHVRGVA